MPIPPSTPPQIIIRSQDSPYGRQELPRWGRTWHRNMTTAGRVDPSSPNSAQTMHQKIEHQINDHRSVKPKKQAIVQQRSDVQNQFQNGRHDYINHRNGKSSHSARSTKTIY